ncbi:hypothetical protein AMATHDRAFT_4294 [Amanita thiersii Skay4041]|uniref:Uncharacterized protein n=1 Tax=Amanita thiersii Skay4041 TaxID=703135 RepID=A0A2A9NGB5_9AGAR|nr:hypothetical protein AMATHDRAFT_4294 [Amanita thiersii Skay4041]
MFLKAIHSISWSPQGKYNPKSSRRPTHEVVETKTRRLTFARLVESGTRLDMTPWYVVANGGAELIDQDMIESIKPRGRGNFKMDNIRRPENPGPDAGQRQGSKRHGGWGTSRVKTGGPDQTLDSRNVEPGGGALQDDGIGSALAAGEDRLTWHGGRVLQDDGTGDMGVGHLKIQDWRTSTPLDKHNIKTGVGALQDDGTGLVLAVGKKWLG